MYKIFKNLVWFIILFFKPKIFCISFQRTGTTSVGNFFTEHGFRVARYNRTRSTRWSMKRFMGDYKGIFNTLEFRSHQVFEDNPWFADDFYKYLYHRFPNAKFILFTRDTDKWFDSMVSHSDGKTLGNTFRHCKLYRREKEFYECFPSHNWSKDMLKIDNKLLLNDSHRKHYKDIYNLRNREIIDFFKYYGDNKRFIHLKLEDPNKWQKLGKFFNIKVNTDYESFKNRSIKK